MSRALTATLLLTMLYAVIQRFDSRRKIETSMTAEVRKLHYAGIDTVPKRCTVSDGNADAQRNSLRRSTGTCMRRTRTCFHRTAGTTATRSG